MYLSGLNLRLIRRHNMWHLKIHTGQTSLLTPLEFSSSIRREPKILYVRRRGPMLILLLDSAHFQWLITIFHNSNRIRLTIQPLPCTASLDTLRDG
ncbi:nonstructural protein [Oya virus]|nr:nonstructural protein [Oya virus]QFZ79360.1 nonstructural protein [Oya virus]